MTFTFLLCLALGGFSLLPHVGLSKGCGSGLSVSKLILILQNTPDLSHRRFLLPLALTLAGCEKAVEGGTPHLPSGLGSPIRATRDGASPRAFLCPFRRALFSSCCPFQSFITLLS